MNFFKLTRKAFAMLCVAFMCFSGCKKDEQRHYDLLPPDPEDVTATGLLTTNIENSGGPNAGEGSVRVTDGDLDSKFLIFSFDPSFYIQLQFKKAQCVTTYSLTSANDADERDPRNWTISASNDGENWVTLDTRTDEKFASRKLTKTYEFENNTAYTYYRLNISAIGGGSLFQLAEWRVISIPLINQ